MLRFLASNIKCGEELEDVGHLAGSLLQQFLKPVK